MQKFVLHAIKSASRLQMHALFHLNDKRENIFIIFHIRERFCQATVFFSLFSFRFFSTMETMAPCKFVFEYIYDYNKNRHKECPDYKYTVLITITYHMGCELQYLVCVRFWSLNYCVFFFYSLPHAYGEQGVWELTCNWLNYNISKTKPCKLFCSE